MSRKTFYLEKRGNIYYAKVIDPETGKHTNARSTGQTDRDLAIAEASLWRVHGLPATKKTPVQSMDSWSAITRILIQLKKMDMNVNDGKKILEILQEKGVLETNYVVNDCNFIDWLKMVYNFESSPYLKDKNRSKIQVSEYHCMDSLGRIRTHWEPEFIGRKVSSISRDDLKKFHDKLKAKKLCMNTVQKIMNVALAAFNWAYKEKYIIVNPAADFPRSTELGKKRDVLSAKEVTKIFSIPWKDERAFWGNLVSSTCGLRSGEILGIRIENILDDRLLVQYSWSRVEGLKCPKNGESRIVPLLPNIANGLRELAKKNPWNDSFVFYSAKKTNQWIKKILTNEFYNALAACDIKPEIRKKRNIVFHSWRHTYTINMTKIVDRKRLAKTTGHRDVHMVDHYDNHIDDDDFSFIANATNVLFKDLGALTGCNTPRK